MISSSNEQAPALLTLLDGDFRAVALASRQSGRSRSEIDAKRAEAQNVLAQIQEIDGQLEHAIEAYNLANVQARSGSRPSRRRTRATS